MTKTRLREAINALGFSQESFARFIGRDPSTVRRWLRGSQTVPREVAMVIELMSARKVSIAQVLQLIGDKADPETFERQIAA